MPDKIRLSKEVWSEFQIYQAAVSNSNVGFFAVSEKGNASGGYYCPEARCGQGARQMSISACLGSAAMLGFDERCFIFAIGPDPRIPFDIEK